MPNRILRLLSPNTGTFLSFVEIFRFRGSGFVIEFLSKNIWKNWIRLYCTGTDISCSWYERKVGDLWFEKQLELFYLWMVFNDISSCCIEVRAFLFNIISCWRCICWKIFVLGRSRWYALWDQRTLRSLSAWNWIEKLFEKKLNYGIELKKYFPRRC